MNLVQLSINRMYVKIQLSFSIIKTYSSNVINQILNKVEYIFWDTKSQPATSEEAEKEDNNGEEKNQVREFINTITDVFDYYEDKGGNN